MPTTGAFLDPNCLLRVVTKARGKMGGGRAFLMLKVLIVFPFGASPPPNTRAQAHSWWIGWRGPARPRWRVLFL